MADTGNDLYLSAVSVWEIAVKSGLGRLPLPGPVARYIPDERAARGINALALDEDAVVGLARLPQLHRDPFDRMLVCQALAGSFALVTPDPEIARYPVRIVW